MTCLTNLTAVHHLNDQQDSYVCALSTDRLVEWKAWFLCGVENSHNVVDNSSMLSHPLLQAQHGAPSSVL